MVARELETGTSWARGFENPVVETSSNNHRSIIHWPDIAADHPQPACDGGRWGGREDVEYVAKELTGGLAAFRVPCDNEKCRKKLEALADELGVEFDK